VHVGEFMNDDTMDDRDTDTDTDTDAMDKRHI
jgi:hypothetical protein